jgi:hypothetical protein
MRFARAARGHSSLHPFRKSPLKRRNPCCSLRIAQEIAHAFGIDMNEDIVPRGLAKQSRPEA